jgi:histidinol-phosphate aminotransferase
VGRTALHRFSVKGFQQSPSLRILRTGDSLNLLPDLLEARPGTGFLVDEMFVDLVGESVAPLVPGWDNPFVARTLSKAHSIAGFRIGLRFSLSVTQELNGDNRRWRE